MTNRAYAFMAGLFVLTLSAALVAVAMWLGGYSVPRNTYIVVSHGSVSGLHAQSTVYYRGVAAGTVDSIKFSHSNIRDILIKIEVDKSIPLTKGTYATLRPQGVTGLTVIDLNDSGKQPQRLQTSAQNPARIPMHPSLINSFLGQGRQILSQVNTLTKRMNKLLAPRNVERVNNILASAETATKHLNELEERADKSLKGIPALSQHADRTLTRIDQLVDNVDRTSDEVRDMAQQINHLTGSGQQVSHTMLTRTLPRLNKLLSNLQDTSWHVRNLSDMLERHPQSLLLGKQPPAPGPGEPGYKEPR